MGYMDEQIQIWNVLHDGDITAVAEEDSDTIKMFVNIPYLRRRLDPLGDSFVLILEGVTELDFEDYDGNKSTLQEEIEVGSIGILSTDSESMPVKVFTSMGQLTLGYKRIRLFLDTGKEIDFETISRVCQEYWDEFKEKSQRKN